MVWTHTGLPSVSTQENKPQLSYSALRFLLTASRHATAAAIAATVAATRNLSTPLIWNANCPPLACRHHIWPRFFLKAGMCIFSQLKPTLGCWDIHFKIRRNYPAAGSETSVSLCDRAQDTHACTHTCVRLCTYKLTHTQKEQSMAGFQLKSFPGRKHKYSWWHEVKAGSPVCLEFREKLEK